MEKNLYVYGQLKRSWRAWQLIVSAHVSCPFRIKVYLLPLFLSERREIFPSLRVDFYHMWWECIGCLFQHYPSTWARQNALSPVCLVHTTAVQWFLGTVRWKKYSMQYFVSAQCTAIHCLAPCGWCEWALSHLDAYCVCNLIPCNSIMKTNYYGYLEQWVLAFYETRAL